MPLTISPWDHKFHKYEYNLWRWDQYTFIHVSHWFFLFSKIIQMKYFIVVALVYFNNVIAYYKQCQTVLNTVRFLYNSAIHNSYTRFKKWCLHAVYTLGSNLGSHETELITFQNRKVPPDIAYFAFILHIKYVLYWLPLPSTAPCELIGFCAIICDMMQTTKLFSSSILI